MTGQFCPFLEDFWHKFDILAVFSFKLQRTYNAKSQRYTSNGVGLIQNIHIWLVNGKVIAKKGADTHIWAYVFYGSSGDCYLSISDEKSNLWCLFLIVNFSGKMGIVQARPYWSGAAPRPDQKVSLPGGPFWPTTFLKLCHLRKSGSSIKTINTLPWTNCDRFCIPLC